MVVTPTKGQRQPDAAVANAVAQVQKNKKFKRMLMFGLRSLSDLCMPPTNKFKENSLSVLEQDVVSTISETIKADPTDEDCAILGCRIFWGISEGLKEIRDDSFNKLFVKQGALDSLVALVNAGTKDEGSMEILLKCLQNVCMLNLPVEPVALVQGILRVMKQNPKAKMGLELVTTLDLLTSTFPVAAEFVAKEGMEDVLAFCSSLKVDANSTAIVEIGLKALRPAAETGKAHPSSLTPTMKLMDQYAGKKAVADRGSAVMASLISPEQLKKCLDTLATAPEGSEDRKNALILLSSMSYIESYAEAIVKAGSLPLLCNALKQSAADIARGVTDPRVVSGLTGTCKMLGKIASDPRHVQAVREAGGASAVISAFSAVRTKPQAATACCVALAPMAHEPALAQEMLSQGSIKAVLELLATNLKDTELIEAGAGVLAGASSHAPVAAEMAKLNTIPVLTSVMKSSKAAPTQVHCVATLSNVASGVPSVDSMKSGGTLDAVVAAVTANSSNSALAVAASALFAKLATLRDASAMAQPNVVDATLALMLAHSDRVELQGHCKAVLEVIATDNDVIRTLRDLDPALSSASRTPDRAMKALAAVGGLSQITRLWPIFEKQNAAAAILSGISGWISGTAFPQRPELVSSGVHCVTNLSQATAGSLDDPILKLTALTLLPQMKGMLDKQQPHDNNALDILSAVETLAALNRIGDPNSSAAPAPITRTKTGSPTSSSPADFALSNVVESVMKVMRKYPDVRLINVHCINILNELVVARNGTAILSQTGSLKLVLAYMQKVSMYEDVQVAGFRLLNQCLTIDPSMADGMKRNGALDVVKAATRTYGKSKAVRAYLSPVAAVLMPGDDLEKEITENLRVIQRGNLNEDTGIVLNAMRNMNQLTVSQLGSRCAARLDVAKHAVMTVTVCTGLRKRAKKPLAELQDTLAETSMVMKNLSEIRLGVGALMKADAVTGICACIDELSQGPESASKKDGLEACAQTLRNLMRCDRLHAGEMACQKGVVPRMLRMMDAYPDDPAIFGASCGAVIAIRHKNVFSIPEYHSCLDRLIEGIRTGDQTRRLQALTALEEMILDPDSDLLEALSKKNCVGALFKVMDDFADDPAIRRQAQRCLEEVSRHKNSRQRWLSDPEGALPVTVGVVKRVLKKTKVDPDDCCMTIRILNHYVTAKDKAVLQQAGLLADIEELTVLYPDHKNLMATVGELLGKVGCDERIAGLMKQIIDCAKTTGPGWPREMEKLCGNLAIYLNADIENPDKALALAQACCNAMAEAMKKNPDANVMASMCAVSRRLVDKYWGNNDIAYGSRATPAMVLAIAGVLGQGDCHTPACRNKKLVCNGLRTLAGALNNPRTRAEALEAVRAQRLLPKMDQLMKTYANDPEVMARILDFMAQVAASADGAQMLPSSVKVSSRKNPLEDLLADITAAMSHHRKSPMVVTAGMECVENLLAHLKPAPEALKNPQFWKDLDAIADGTPEGLAASMATKKRAIGVLSNEECGMQLKNAYAKWMKALEDEMMSPDKKKELTMAMAGLTGAFAAAGLFDELKKAGAVEAMAHALEEHAGDLEVQREVMKRSRELAKDADVSAKLLRENGELYMTDCLAAVDGDAMAAQELLSLMISLAETEGNGRLMAKSMNFKNLINTMGMAAAAANPHDAQTLQEQMQRLNKLVEDDVPEVLSLKKMYEKWSGRLAAGETLNMVEATTVLQQLDFVSDYTEEYSKEQLRDLQAELGSEFSYGCRCFSLLHQYPENSQFCLDKKEPDFMIAAIKRQRNEHVDQFPIIASSDACQYKEVAEAYAQVKDAALIIADALRRGREIAGVADPEREEMLIPRLQLVERVAFERVFFNNTDAMVALIGLWDDFDSGKYSTILLRHVFRAMRQIVNDHFVPIILKNDVPRRLIDVVNKKDADIELLPDVLFLLGTLAVVPQIKTMIGELKGCEACLELLQRCLKNPNDTSRVQTNACLALANITIGHGPNISKFTAAKGPDINIDVMNNSMSKRKDYDVANGASILMCNTCFKRDDMKEVYGKKGGPLSVMATIKKYDGSADKAALRCLNSMFKAIGNLALYTPNVVVFLDNKIEMTLVHFYTKSENLPDSLIETSLRTVSNLVMENTESAMTRFGVILEPLLRLLEKGDRSTVSMLSMCFETLGCLCRLPANAKKFASNGGIETVLKILNNECDEALYSNGIFVLGIQTTNPASVDILVDHGVFTFLVALFDQQVAKVAEIEESFEGGGCMATELVVSALRCVRRLLLNKRAGDEFLAAGGIQALVAMTGKIDDHTMIHLETYRVILALLDLNPPPPPPPPPSTMGRGDRDWDAEVLDEGVLPAVALCDRPPSPRSWESIGLSASQISEIVTNIGQILVKEENSKQLRLARCGLGLLAYFACEKIDGTIEGFYNGGMAAAIDTILESFEGDPEIVYTACFAINNVAFASDQAMYAMLRKERKMRVNLDLATKAIGTGDKKIKDFCTMTFKLLNEKSTDPARFSVHQQWDYPLSLTLWNKDAYPNGVQDLPQDMREEIRNGGKFRILIDEKTKEVLHWRGSFDMLLFQWRIDPKEGPFTESVAAARIKTIGRGYATQSFQQIVEKMGAVNRPSQNSCCVLGALPGIDLPEGAELKIICGSKRARDRFVALLTEWRDAATYGF